MSGDDRNPASDAESAGDASQKWFPTVGIGTSAGGVHALQVFFESLPDDVDAAFVVIVHLDPAHQSELPNILAARTRMPVAQVTGRIPLEPGRVYVIPPNRQLIVANQHLLVAEFDEPRWRRTPIDLFFRSLAAQQGDDFAIVLSGAGSDGAVGIKAVKEAGGIILVQDPGQAEYSSMPQSAVATGLADFVLPVREIAQRLPELIRVRGVLSRELLSDSETADMQRILSHLRVRTGHDFTNYKKADRPSPHRPPHAGAARGDDGRLSRRPARERGRIAGAVRRPPDLGDDVLSRPRRVRQARDDGRPAVVRGQGRGGLDPRLGAGLRDRRGSLFDRDPAARGGGAARDPLRNSGLRFRSRRRRAGWLAREGRYPLAIEADMTDDRLRRFFTRESDHYRVTRDLRDIVLFAKHSLLKDPPFSRVDLISCRNVLIYLDRQLQQQVCATFHFALKPSGYLFLGSSESADSPDRHVPRRRPRGANLSAHVPCRPRCG